MQKFTSSPKLRLILRKSSERVNFCSSSKSCWLNTGMQNFPSRKTTMLRNTLL